MGLNKVFYFFLLLLFLYFLLYCRQPLEDIIVILASPFNCFHVWSPNTIYTVYTHTAVKPSLPLCLLGFFSQRTFQEICKGVHMQKNQGQQFKKSPGSKYKYASVKERVIVVVTSCWGLEGIRNIPWHKSITLSPAEPLQKSPVVRLKDSAFPVNLRESTEEQQATIQEELTLKDQTVYSYQQISCLDSVIRYSVRVSCY